VGGSKIETDLIFNNSIPEVFGEIAHSVSIYITFLGTDTTGALRYDLQLIFDLLKSSGVGSVWILTHR